MNELLTDRWTPFRPHAEQRRLWRSTARFRTVPAGRRSGKTEIAKRFTVLAAMMFAAHTNGRFVQAAPTHLQAKHIFWEDVKQLTPKWALHAPGNLRRSTSESELSLRLRTGAEIIVAGLDRPERIEGPPLDGIVLDEYANMRADVWEAHVRPALSTPGRPGWAWFIGVPEGRNHYYDLAQIAQADRTGEWSHHHWLSADILDPAEVESMRRALDELTFKQEAEGSFVTFAGQAYYSFDLPLHTGQPFTYQPKQPLIICLDFNVSPGVAVIAQEFPENYLAKQPEFTGILGEVWIPRGSNTPAVCRKLIADWGKHKGEVHVYGDPTGGAKGTAKVRGSDWDLVREHLGPIFGDRLSIRVPSAPPRERSRVNAVNSRLLNTVGEVHLRIDPRKAPHIVKDFDGVRVLEGGAGEIDKQHDKKLTHLTDAIGYYIERMFPTVQHVTVSESY